MMTMYLAEAASALNARQSGADVLFRGVSTDSRTLMDGNLFVAINGPNFDGHNYLYQAHRQGAAAAVVSRTVETSLPLLEVDDTLTALGRLAACWRSRFKLPLVAITGSNGKTTTREMLSAILGRCGETLTTRGNFNNEIGLPLTLSGLDARHRFAVVELGANHPGEIAALTAMAQPSIAIINNAGPAHLEGFGSLEGVARAKGELFEGLAADGVCILNADDDFTALWRSMAAPRQVISFGLEKQAEVTASWKGDIDGSDIELHTPVGQRVLRLPFPGRHNVMNALAATAAAIAVDVSLDDIAQGLAAARPVRGRWQMKPGIEDMQIIDDTYNANPGSLGAAMRVLSQDDNENWLVLGDMGELGSEAASLHVEVGDQARQLGFGCLFALGPLAQQAAEAFGSGAEVFENIEDLIKRLRQLARPGVRVLVKGSRAMRMERVVEALRLPSDSEERV